MKEGMFTKMWGSLKVFLGEERPDGVASAVTAPEVQPSSIETVSIVGVNEQSANFVPDVQPLKRETVAEPVPDVETWEGVKENWERMKQILQEEVKRGAACNYTEIEDDQYPRITLVLRRGYFSDDTAYRIKIYAPRVIKKSVEWFQKHTNNPNSTMKSWGQLPRITGSGDGLYLNEEEQEKIRNLFSNRGVQFEVGP